MRPTHRAAPKTHSQIVLLRCLVLQINADGQGACPFNLRHLQKKCLYLLRHIRVPAGSENTEQIYLLAASIAVQSDFSRANRIGNCAVFMLAEIHPCSACGPEHIAHYGNKITNIVVAVKADEQVCKLCDQRVLQVGFSVGSAW